MDRVCFFWLLSAAAAWLGTAAGRASPSPWWLWGILALLFVLPGRHRNAAGACCAILAVMAGHAALSSDDACEGEKREGRIAGRLLALHEVRNGFVAEIETVADGNRCPISIPRHDDPTLDTIPEEVHLGATISTLIRTSPISHRRSAPSLAGFFLEDGSGSRPWWSVDISWPQNVRARAKERLLRPSEQSPSGGLLLAILIGDRSALPASAWLDLRASGIAHVAVISGLHVASMIWLATSLWLIRSGRRHPSRQILLIPIVLLFGAIVPSTPPIRRAISMVLVFVPGSLRGRDTPSTQILSMVVLGLLLLDPSLATSISFALTVCATASLLLANRMEGATRRIALAWAPILASWPIIVSISGCVSPWSIVANALVLPAAFPGILFGWLWVCVPEGFIGAASYEAIAHAAAEWILFVAAEIARWPGSGAIAAPTGWLWAGSHSLLLLGWLLLWRRRVLWLVLGALLSATWLWPFRPTSLPGLPADSTRGEAMVQVIDVGQGQAVALSAKSQHWLIDAGDDRLRDARSSLIAAFRRRGVRKLEGLLISHADRDHAGGTAEILQALRPRRLLVPPGMIDAPAFRSAVQRAARLGIPLSTLSRGDLVGYADASLQVLHPDPASFAERNEGSLVIYAHFGEMRVLIPGDIGFESERSILAAFPESAVDLLLAAHHGSSLATSTPWLEAFSPQVVAVSCGRGNRFEHPGRAAIARIRAYGSRIRTTECAGTMSFSIARGRLDITTERAICRE